VTFADSVLHLVRAGARIDSRSASDAPDSPESPAAAEAGVLAEAVAVADAAPEEGVLEVELAAQAAQADPQFEPGLGDLEAAVGLVSSGLATRVILSGFQSWPGLLWRAYQLADTKLAFSYSRPSSVPAARWTSSSRGITAANG
jgi:hypothetical protein